MSSGIRVQITFRKLHFDSAFSSRPSNLGSLCRIKNDFTSRDLFIYTINTKLSSRFFHLCILRVSRKSRPGATISNHLFKVPAYKSLVTLTARISQFWISNHQRSLQFPTSRQESFLKLIPAEGNREQEYE